MHGHAMEFPEVRQAWHFRFKMRPMNGL